MITDKSNLNCPYSPYRLAGPEERTALLDRLPKALERTNWTLLTYALMSSHIHLALLAGDAPA